MNRVNMREARRRLAGIVASAEHGRSVAITRRGRIVARVEPAPPPGGRSLPDLVKFRQGIARKGGPLSAAVLESRRSERS